MSDHGEAPSAAKDRVALRMALFSIFALSGVAGLMYEAVWGRYLRLFLGHSAHAQTFVIAIFMGGMAIGAWISSRYSTRWRSLLRGYALVEIAIGVFALCFQTLFEAATDWAYSTVMPALESPGAVYAFKQIFALSLILPPSVLLGMTFPLMSGGVIRLFPRISGSSLSMLYFTNSIGASMGVLLTGFVFVKWVGLPGTMLLAGMINIFIGLTMFLISKNVEEPELTDIEDAGDNPTADDGRPVLLLTVAGLTGLASFIYEIAWIRMLSMILGSTSHAFELMLATFIAGLAFGGLWVKKRIDTLKDPVVFLGRVQWIMGILAIATIFFYNMSFDGMHSMMLALSRTDEGYFLFNIGSNLLAIAIMFPAAFCAGTTLPLITYSLLRNGYGEKSIGLVYSSNTVGAIIGVFFSTHIALPYIGLKNMVCLGAAVDICLGLALIWKVTEKLRPIPTTLTLAATAVVAFAATGVQFDPLKMASGVYRTGELLSTEHYSPMFHKDGKTASIDVLKSEQIIIMTNGKPDASLHLDPKRKPTQDEATQALSGVLPLAVYPDAKSVAVIGLGSGMTSTMLLASESLERLDTIEIEPAMVEGARLFSPRNDPVYNDPRSHIIYEDARTYFSAQKAKYDVIMSEPSNPWVSGVATLFSEEFYRRIAMHLNEGGVLTQWLQLYELEPKLFASVINALSKTFDDYTLFATDNANILIVARLGGKIGPLSQSVFDNKKIRDELWRHRILNLNVLESHRIANARALRPLFASYDAPANSDYFPFLDAHTARSRFLSLSSSAVSAMVSAPIPVLEILGDTTHGKGWLEAPLATLQDTQDVRFSRINKAIEASSIGRRLTGHDDAERQPLNPSLIDAVESVRNHLIACQPTKRPVSRLRHDIIMVGSAITSHLDPSSLDSIWGRVQAAPCYQDLAPELHLWVELFQRAGRRDGAGLLAPAVALWEMKLKLDKQKNSYLLVALMTGYIQNGDADAALKLWESDVIRLIGSDDTPMLFRLLYAHAKTLKLGEAKAL